MDSDSDTEPQIFQHPPHPSLPLTLTTPETYDCQLLVIAQEGTAALFAHSLIGPLKPSNRLNFSKSKQGSLADLYLDSQKNVFLIFNEALPPMKEVLFSKFLENSIRSERTVLLMSVASTTLQEPNCPALTCLSTSCLRGTVTLPHFPEGVTGLWAEVLAHGEIEGKPVCGFMAAMKEYELTSQLVDEAFGGLRGKYGLKGQFDIGDRVRKYNMKQSSNHLYL